MLNVTVLGAGPALCMVHGWGINSRIFSAFAGELASRFKVYLVDLPGYGLSPSIHPYDLEHIVHLLDSALLEPAVVCGWSLGGSVVLKLAALAPEKIKGLILVSTTPRFTKQADWAHAVEKDVLLSFAQDLEQDYPGTLRRFFALQALGGAASHEVITHLHTAAMPTPSAQTLQAGLQLLLDIDLRRDVGAIEQACLIVHGKQDKLVPWKAAVWLATTLDKAELLCVDQAGHAPFLSHSEEILSAVIDFMTTS